MNTIGYFEIQSSNPKRDIKFYEAVFEWKFIKEEAVLIEYYRIETNSINGGLLKRGKYSALLSGCTPLFLELFPCVRFNYKMRSYILSTERLGLRKWLASDVEPFSKMNKDEVAMKYFPKKLTHDETIELVNRIKLNFDKNHSGLFAVEHKMTRQFTG